MKRAEIGGARARRFLREHSPDIQGLAVQIPYAELRLASANKLPRAPGSRSKEAGKRVRAKRSCPPTARHKSQALRRTVADIAAAQSTSPDQQLVVVQRLAADLAEHLDQVLDLQALALVAADVEHDLAGMEHDGAVAEVERLAHRVRHHHRR